MGTSRVMNVLVLAILAFSAWGCHHPISFEDLQYNIDSPKQETPLVVVIDSNTLNQVTPIKSWTTGIANTWDAKPGEMLKQVADVEFPQMFSSYKSSSEEKPVSSERGTLTLLLSVPQYTFEGFQARVIVRAKLIKKRIASYLIKHTRRMELVKALKWVFGGAFAMKSAVRQSSIDAYKKVFTELRTDLLKALRE